MEITDLLGFEIRSCIFSKSNYKFYLNGSLNDADVLITLNTHDNFSDLNGEKRDAYEKISLVLWPFLEKKIINIEVNESEASSIVFYVEGGGAFVIWSDEPQTDNLIIIKNEDTGDWSPVC